MTSGEKMKYSRFLILLIFLLFLFPISSVSIENNDDRDWVHVEIGKDNSKHLKRERSQLRGNAADSDRL